MATYLDGRQDGAEQAAAIVFECANACEEQGGVMTPNGLREIAQAIMDNAQNGLVENA